MLAAAHRAPWLEAGSPKQFATFGVNSIQAPNSHGLELRDGLDQICPMTLRSGRPGLLLDEPSEGVAWENILQTEALIATSVIAQKMTPAACATGVIR